MNQDLQDENDLIRRAASAQDQLALSKHPLRTSWPSANS